MSLLKEDTTPSSYERKAIKHVDWDLYAAKLTEWG